MSRISENVAATYGLQCLTMALINIFLLNKIKYFSPCLVLPAGYCVSDTVYRVLCGTVEYDHCPTAGSKSV